jgi:hypothetical protein
VNDSVRQVTIHADPNVYASFPEIIRTDEAMIVTMLCQDLEALRKSTLHPHHQPVVKMRYAVSADQGRTWTVTDDPPSFGPVRHASRFAAGLDGGGMVRIQRWYYPGTTTAEPLRARLYRGRLADPEEILITDGGPAGWTPADMVPVIFDIARLKDGTFLGAAYARVADSTPRDAAEGKVLEDAWPKDAQRWTCFFYKGSPDGREWKYLSTIPNRHTFCLGEPSIAVMGDGRIVCLIRTDWPVGYKDLLPAEVNGNGTKRDGYGWWLYQTESTDGGLTWTEPVQLPIWGHPPNLLPLANGNLLMVYGHRRPPFSVRAVLSRDGGRTWDLSTLKTLRSFDPASYDLGYPVATQLPNEEILCCCYGYSTPDAGEKAPHGVFGTIFTEEWLAAP